MEALPATMAPFHISTDFFGCLTVGADSKAVYKIYSTRAQHSVSIMINNPPPIQQQQVKVGAHLGTARFLQGAPSPLRGGVTPLMRVGRNSFHPDDQDCVVGGGLVTL